MIGTSEYSDDELLDLPAVKAAIDGLALALTSPEYGLVSDDDRHCVTLMNERDGREIGRQLGSAADKAEDLLLIYYAGHGVIGGRRHELYLGLSDSTPKRPGFNSLAYADLRDMVLDSVATTKLLVLDCDFSGGELDSLDIEGACVISSGQPTAISSGLIGGLREGMPDGPAFLSIDDIYRSLAAGLKSDERPQSQKHGGSPPIAKNRALLKTDQMCGVARQILRAIDASAGPAGEAYLEEWMLDWLGENADALIGRAPTVAADLLDHAAANVPFDSEGYAWLTSRLAHALFFTGELEQAQQVAKLTLECTTDPDLLVHAHTTLAQCLGISGSAADATKTLGRVLDLPGLSARHRARLLVPAARTHFHLGEFGQATKVAKDALAAASDAGDKWAMGWALHVIATVALVQGRLAEALSVHDRALTVTQSDPALTDLRILLQVNKASTLGNLDRYEEALDVATQAQTLADRCGTAIRITQAHAELNALQFETGQWGDALAGAAKLVEDRQEPAVACNDLGTAAVIHFHRDESEAARRSMDMARPHAGNLGQRFIAQWALAQSMDHELAGDLDGALNVLMVGLDDGIEEHGEIDFVLPDAMRLAVLVGERDAARKFAEHAATLAEGSRIPHRVANGLYCRGMLESDPEKLVAAAEKYEEARRPLYSAMAYEAAAAEFVGSEDDESRSRARDAMSRAVEAYEFLGAVADVERMREAFRRHGIRRGPHSRHRRAESGWESLTPMEEKVAAFVSEGLSNPEVAERLGLSADRRDARLAHPQEAARCVPGRHRAGVGAAGGGCAVGKVIIYFLHLF